MRERYIFRFLQRDEILFVLLACTVISGCSSSTSTTSVSHTLEGVFVPVASEMVQRRDGGIAIALPDGRVLIVGGVSNVSGPLPAEFFDPSSGSFKSLGLTGLLYENGGVLLDDGTVLLADGRNKAAVIFDPATGLFKKTGAPVVYRDSYTMTKLRDGRVLLAGGADFSTSSLLDSAEIYDPATDGFSLTGNLVNARSSHIATLLLDGHVLLAGGNAVNLTIAQDTAEMFDPATGTFALAGHMTAPRQSFTSTLLNSGKVLLAGGLSTGPTALSSAELYDPATGVFMEVGDMGHAHGYHTAALLADGRVLISGGADSFSPAVIIQITASACIYDPNSNEFSPTGSMTVPRKGHSMTLLKDGTVLVAGGNATTATGASAELFK